MLFSSKILSKRCRCPSYEQHVISSYISKADMKNSLTRLSLSDYRLGPIRRSIYSTQTIEHESVDCTLVGCSMRPGPEVNNFPRHTSQSHCVRSYDSNSVVDVVFVGVVLQSRQVELPAKKLVKLDVAQFEHWNPTVQ